MIAFAIVPGVAQFFRVSTLSVNQSSRVGVPPRVGGVVVARGRGIMGEVFMVQQEAVDDPTFIRY